MQIYYCCGCLQHVVFGDKCVFVLIVLTKLISLGLNIDCWMMIDILINNFGDCKILYSFFYEVFRNKHMHF
jgi:hypothetical protein